MKDTLVNVRMTARARTFYVRSICNLCVTVDRSLFCLLLFGLKKNLSVLPSIVAHVSAAVLRMIEVITIIIMYGYVFSMRV